ncbi:hypothetical protein ABDX87_27830 [Pseudomonas abietaniphila]|uniref:hypothetical protein n=1 Tax=Pseudomonas abietaniphila TaxID=89065 RepID=UPI003217B8DE
MKIIYGQFNYLPFESSWAVFIKAGGLNLIPPHSLIKTFSDRAGARYWAATDMNSARLASGLGLSKAAISRCFIDHVTSGTQRESAAFIRHCPQCIAAGYHSVFFLLHIFKRCPWHDELLTHCRSCSRACSPGGMSIRAQNEAFNASIRCGHFAFCSTGSVRLSVITADQWHAYASLGLALQKWFNAARKINSPLIDYASSLYDAAYLGGSVPTRQEQMINCGLQLALSAVGPIPASQAISSTPLPPLEVNTTPYRADDAVFQPDHETLFAMYRSVRHYLYKRYVRAHAACYRYLTTLTTQGLHALDSTCACTASAAFLAWRLALRYDYGEGGPINLTAPSHAILPTTQRQIMALWITHFYAIWSGIERTNASCSMERDRFSVALSSNVPPLTLGNEVVCICGYAHSRLLQLTTVHVDPQWLVSQSAERCQKRRSTADQSNVRARETVQFWSYQPHPATLLRFWYNPYVKMCRNSPVVAAG